jgi:hypothetical protein
MSIDTAEPQYKYLHSDSGQTRPLFSDRSDTPSLDLHKIGDPAIDLPKPGVSSEQGLQLDSHRPNGTIIVGIANTALLALASHGDTEPIHISGCPSGYFTWYGQVRDTNARIANVLLQSSIIATSSAPSQAICMQSLDSCLATDEVEEDGDTIEFKWTRRRHRIRQLAKRYSESTNADH